MQIDWNSDKCKTNILWNVKCAVYETHVVNHGMLSDLHSHQYLSPGHFHCSLLQTHFCLIGGGKTLASHRCSVGFNTVVCMRNDHVVNKLDRLISSRTINTREWSCFTRFVIVVKYNGACCSNITVLWTILLLAQILGSHLNTIPIIHYRRETVHVCAM